MPQLSLTDVNILRNELVGLFDHIQRIRKEIAAIHRPSAPGEDDRFAKMSDELDAIVEATEEATEIIMANAERMEEEIAEAKSRIGDSNAEVLTILDAIPERTAAIFEACAFQDITGQRITKVVKSLQYIEHRVNALVSIWGTDKVSENEPLPNVPQGEASLLNGPQLRGQGVSQADVDALFAPDKGDTAAPLAQDSIDDLFK